MIALAISSILFTFSLAFLIWAGRHAAEAAWDRKQAQRLNADAADHFRRAQQLYVSGKDLS